jgi:hypothetical protein
MALAETQEDDKVEIIQPYSHISVRTKTIVTRDGEIISESFARRGWYPCILVNGVWQDTDLSAEPQKVQDTASVWWTDAVKTAYKTAMDNQQT